MIHTPHARQNDHPTSLSGPIRLASSVRGIAPGAQENRYVVMAASWLHDELYFYFRIERLVRAPIAQSIKSQAPRGARVLGRQVLDQVAKTGAAVPLIDSAICGRSCSCPRRIGDSLLMRCQQCQDDFDCSCWPTSRRVQDMCGDGIALRRRCSLTLETHSR